MAELGRDHDHEEEILPVEDPVPAREKVPAGVPDEDE